MVAKAAGIPSHSFPIKLPITDANSTILQLVQAAGPGGGVILDFTPDSAPALMKAAIAQGLVDKVKWGSSTPIANAFMAKQFPQFDGKMLHQLGVRHSTTARRTRTSTLQITKKYAPSIAPQAFGQMGFMDAKFATQALLNVKGPVTAKSYNAAVKASRTSRRTCSASRGTSATACPYHIPNNTDITVDLQGRQGRDLKEKCFAIQAVDPEIAQTRDWEKKFNLNTGK